MAQAKRRGCIMCGAVHGLQERLQGVTFSSDPQEFTRSSRCPRPEPDLSQEETMVATLDSRLGTAFYPRTSS